jgi:hypothetical protein
MINFASPERFQDSTLDSVYDTFKSNFIACLAIGRRRKHSGLTEYLVIFSSLTTLNAAVGVHHNHLHRFIA